MAAAGRLIETRQERSNFNTDDVALSGSFTRRADNGNILNLNAQGSKLFFSETEVSRQTSLIGLVDRTRRFRRTDEPYAYELGADYQFALGPGRLKLIAFHGLADGPDEVHWHVVGRAELARYESDTLGNNVNSAKTKGAK